MALKTRKSMAEELRKLFSNEKPADAPTVPQQGPVDVPIQALRISRYGLVQELQLTFYRKSDQKFRVGENYYNVPRCMQAPGATDLDPAIRRFTWVFKKEFATNATAAKQEAFMGAYSVWYKDFRTWSGPRTLSQIDGDFWVMKQVQSEPGRGATVQWQDLPRDMVCELNTDWWFMAVQLPDIDTVCREYLASLRGGPS